MARRLRSSRSSRRRFGSSRRRINRRRFGRSSRRRNRSNRRRFGRGSRRRNRSNRRRFGRGSRRRFFGVNKYKDKDKEFLGKKLLQYHKTQLAQLGQHTQLPTKKEQLKADFDLL